MARATASEQAFLRALVLGDIRQGALAAVVGDAVAKAAGVPVTAVRRALMLRGDLGAVAEAALGDGDLVRVPARGRAPDRADARPDGAGRGRGAREDGTGGGRMEARRRADPGPPRRRRGGDLHAHARQRDGAAAGGGRGGASAAGDARSCSTARRSRCARTADRTRSRSPGAGSRAAPRPCCSRRCSSTCCISTARTCSTGPARSARRRCRRWSPSRGGSRAAGRRCSRRRWRRATRASS